MNIDDLSLHDLRLMHDALYRPVADNPELENLKKFRASIDKKIKADPRYKKGKKLLEKAIKNGLEDGYCNAEDYYFAVSLEDITDWNDKIVAKNVQLLLCFKHNWWMNGETFRVHEDGSPVRNFSDFLTPAMNDKYEPDGYGSTQEELDELRTQLLSAGLEELPALIPIYEAHCKAANEQRNGYRKKN